MKAFYKIENNKAQVGSGTFVPESFIEYIVGQEPQELLDVLEAERAEQNISSQIQEAKAYLTETGWIWEKYNRNVLVLKDMTSEEFNLKYSDVISKQEEYRALINELEVQVEVTNDKVSEIISETEEEV